MGTKEKLAQYIEQELKDVKILLERKPSWWLNPKKTKQETIARVYGVAMFCQYFDDIEYSEIKDMYEKFRYNLDILIAD